MNVLMVMTCGCAGVEYDMRIIMDGKRQWMDRMNMTNFKRTYLLSRTVTSIARIQTGCLFILSKIQILLS